ncbi:Uncharacterised protein [Yersinia similis]|nr:Uncharacterised protein [Yersinia similis]
MRMTSRKKEILSYYEPDNREWVTGEIGAPPLDVSGVAYMLFGSSAVTNLRCNCVRASKSAFCSSVSVISPP